jgi:uncharacterized protein (DUF1697 family)
MLTYIALFRGINVGGRNSIKMADLRSLLENIGLRDVQSYIQSGNVVFRTEETDAGVLSEKIRNAIGENYEFTPDVMIISDEDFDKILAENPFPEAESEASKLHIGFLDAEPEEPNLDGLQELKKDTEQYELKSRAFYLYAPDGIGRSKLYAKAEKLIGVSMTSRNWRTVKKIQDMAH